MLLTLAIVRLGLNGCTRQKVAKMIVPVTTLPLASRHRVAQISFHPTQPYLAVQSHDRSVEILRIRTEDEARKKQARRRKRALEKKGKSKDENNSGADMEIDKDQDVELADLFTPYLVVRANGKIRSFDFGNEEGSKGGLPVRGYYHYDAHYVYEVRVSLLVVPGACIKCAGSV